MTGPRIDIAKCRYCRTGISRLENDDTWLHNLAGFLPENSHEAEPAPETIRPLYAYPGLQDAEPG